MRWLSFLLGMMDEIRKKSKAGVERSRAALQQQYLTATHSCCGWSEAAITQKQESWSPGGLAMAANGEVELYVDFDHLAAYVVW